MIQVVLLLKETAEEINDQNYITENFEGTDSLKAWKKMQEKQMDILREKETRSRLKSAKKTDSKKDRKSKSPIQTPAQFESQHLINKAETQPNPNPKVRASIPSKQLI